MTITARGFVYFVHVLTPNPGVRFSDNYVDLRDGDSVMIDVTGLDIHSDPAALEVRHLR
ncbi:glycoside hydrolase family 2 protein [Cryptosporangium sp. NPDC048952]|uniref:glycoside hydrolase family 2 protein n=1 Tax=Cryptosporangium sp. NPDC048952 TaxID=3363961 RepID=UPI003719AB48